MKEERLYEVQIDFPKGPYYALDEDLKPAKISDGVYSDGTIMRHSKRSIEEFSREVRVVSQKMSQTALGRSLTLLLLVPGFYKTKACMETKMDEIIGSHENAIYLGGYGAINRMVVKSRHDGYTL